MWDAMAQIVQNASDGMTVEHPLANNGVPDDGVVIEGPRSRNDRSGLDDWGDMDLERYL